MVKAEYLIAMKLRAYRYYKHDISDIVGILCAHHENGDSLTMDRINRAVTELYGAWDGISPEARKFIEERIRLEDYAELFAVVEQNEKKMRDDLMEIKENYPEILSNGNIKNVIESLRRKKEQSNISIPDQSDRRDSK